MEKYNLNPVNYYTGKPDITVPIYNIKAGNVNYPISLVYDAGGVKVDQIASNVGLGWNLTSAILTRTINQENDFDNTGSLNLQSDSNTYSAADKAKDIEARYEYNTEGKIGYFLQKQYNIHLSDQHRRIDFIPDTYHFYANGFTTSFFFNDENTPIEINPKGTQIIAIKSKQRFDKKVATSEVNANWQYVYIPEYNLLTQDFFTIIIKTSDGIEYTFADCDISFNQNINFNNQSSDMEKVHSPAQISAWHISQIRDINSNKKINFEYQDYNLNPNQSDTPLNESLAQRSFEFISYPTFPCWNESCTGSSCGYPISTSNMGYFELTRQPRIDVTIKYLRKIKFDEGELSFKYSGDGDPQNNQSGGPRWDVYGSEYPTDLLLKNKNQDIVKNFQFYFDYFESSYNIGEFNPDGYNNPLRYKRLKLVGFQEIGKPKYNFSYYENKKLPPINSFSVDFLGYYNNSQDVADIAALYVKPAPKLYYYPNNFEKSLLPFPLINKVGYTFPGYFNREANASIDYVQAWSLQKIIFPTGGFTEFKYEINDFEDFGQNIKGGGIRIKQQTLNDGLGIEKTLNYSYLKSNSSTSSGKLFSYPNFGHPTKQIFPTSIDYQSDPPIISTPTPILNPSLLVSDTVFFFKLFGKSNLNADLTSGSFVGYSRVIENEIGKGKKEYTFTSSDSADFENTVTRLHPLVAPFTESPGNFCASDFIIANSAFGSHIFTDNSYKRGKLINEKSFNNNDILLSDKSLGYNNVVFDTKSYHQPFTRIISTGSDSANNFMHLLTSKKDFKIAQFLKSNETTRTYDNLGNFIAETTNYTYNAGGFLKTIENLSSNGDSNKTEFNYPTEVTTSLNSLPGFQMGFADNYFYRNFTFTHRKNDVIQTNYYKNSTLNSSVRKIFDIYSPLTNYDNFISPRGVIIGRQNEETQKSSIITKTDSDYNPIEFYSQNGETISVIWGYNKTKIIAKIENLEIANIPSTTTNNLQALSNADFDNCRTATCKEQLLRNALNALRISLKTTYPNALVNTFTFDPLVGVTSVTDAKEDVQYYIYDDLERLLRVEDKQGNVVSENQYHYKY